MKLYHSPTSPYVRKVRVLLLETGQSDDVELVNAGGTPFAPSDALMARNPLTKVPALELADGSVLFDSRVICAYFDDRAKAGLYQSGAAHWQARTLEALADGMLDAALLIVFEGRLRPEEKQMEEWCDAQWAKIERACAVMTHDWMGHLGGPLDMGQIAAGCALSYLDFRLDARGWRKDNDALAAWFKAFESRASMVATRPPTG
ncbi:MAG: glutathione S-transferase [Rhodobacteraceae bacterium]|nr:glutathione S-transferase [Paracoccaceae bacterium]